MNIFKNLSKALIGFFVLVSIIVTSTSVLAAEIVGRLSVHWSPKHHSAKHAIIFAEEVSKRSNGCLLYTSPSPRDRQKSRMPSSA